MSTRALNPAPTAGAVLRAQVRMVALLQRRDFMIIGGIAAGLIALAFWGQTSVQVNGNSSNDAAIPIFAAVSLPLMLVGALWPIGVWRLDDPARRGYFWSMPVAQAPHTLLRVVAGWLLLECVCLAAMVLGPIITVPSLMRDAGMSLSLESLWVPLVMPTLPYLLVSALVIAFEHPIRLVAWFWASVLAAFVVTQIGDSDVVEIWVARAVGSFVAAAFAPIMLPLDGMDLEGPWWPHFAGWFGAALVAVVLASYRRRDVS